MWLCKNQVTSCSVLELFYCCTNVYRNMHGATSTTKAAWWVDMVFVRFPCCGSDGHDVLGSKPLFPPVKNSSLTKSCSSFCMNIPQKSSVGTIFNCCRMFFITLQVQKDCELPSKGSSCHKKVHRVDWELQHPGRLCTARTIISHPIITFALRMQESLCTYVHIITLTLALSITHHIEKLYIYLHATIQYPLYLRFISAILKFIRVKHLCGIGSPTGLLPCANEVGSPWIHGFLAR